MQWDDFWDGILADVELLLVHAAGRGYRLDDTLGAALLQARAARHDAVLTPETGTGLINLYGQLSQQAKPATAESLRNSAGTSLGGALRYYRNYVSVLMVLIVPISLATFVSFGLSGLMKKDLDIANSLQLRLQGELLHQPDPAAAAAPAPAAEPALPSGVNQSDVDEQLQQLTTELRVIYNRAVIIRGLTLFLIRDPVTDGLVSKQDKFQSMVDTAQRSRNVATTKIRLLGEVAPFAEELMDCVNVMYGAVNACILPILYAWLGACAFLLRRLCRASEEGVFTGQVSATGRMVMAGIGGMVIGFFNNLVVDGGVSISPFALAFLVGYAVDMFYGVLETAIAGFAGTLGQQFGAKSGTAAPAKS